MVAKTPPSKESHRPMDQMSAFNPILVRETVRKVDKVMARLQELQYTVTGGTKVIGGVNLSPRSTRGYIRTSLRCKQESIRIRNTALRKAPCAEIERNSTDEWRRMSLPAMLVGETVGEILQASKFAKQLVDATWVLSNSNDPKTPVGTKTKPNNKTRIELHTRRKKEKQERGKPEVRGSPPLRRARSRINFKVSAASERLMASSERAEASSERKAGEKKDNQQQHAAFRVSPKHKPWARKAVLFPNPLFLSSPSSQKPKFIGKTRSPIIARTSFASPSQTPKFTGKTRSPPFSQKPKLMGKTRSPHKTRSPPHIFAIKSPDPPPSMKFSVKIKSPPLNIAKKPGHSSLKSLPSRMNRASRVYRSISPSNLAKRLGSPLKKRLGSPLKSAKQMLVGSRSLRQGSSVSELLMRRFSGSFSGIQVGS
ncbi:hypothetical protein AMTRI_Chr01g135750 [Amborella trichopoda]